jgi:tetratricopeptide (TPR) repeat protein
LSAVQVAYAEGCDTHAWQLAWVLADYLERCRSGDGWIAVQRTAIEAARRLRDPRAEAHSHRGLAIAHTVLGHYAVACTEHERAFALFGAAGDTIAQGRAQLGRAYALRRDGRPQEALAAAELAVDILRDGPRDTLARAMNALGFACTHAGQHRRALTHCERALTIQREIGDRYGAADSVDSLGYINAQLGDHASAGRRYRQAIGLYRSIGERYGEAVAWRGLGDSRHRDGQTDQARAAWQRALELFEEIEAGEAADVRDRLKAGATG